MGKLLTKKLAVLTGLLCISSVLGSMAWADIIHLHNGKVIHTKVKRVTGELIEYNSGNWTGRSGVKRIELTSRRDVVETMGGERVFGEIIYIDKFKVELHTPSGMRKLNRLFVTNIVLGTPKVETDIPVSYVESNRQQYSGNKPMVHPATHTGGMLEDRIPVQDTTPNFTDDSFEE